MSSLLYLTVRAPGSAATATPTPAKRETKRIRRGKPRCQFRFMSVICHSSFEGSLTKNPDRRTIARSIAQEARTPSALQPQQAPRTMDLLQVAVPFPPDRESRFGSSQDVEAFFEPVCVE